MNLVKLNTETMLGKGVIKAADGLVESVGTAFDSNFTTKEERIEAQTKIVDAANEVVMHAQKLQGEIIAAETSGTKLQRSWRPIVMLAFAFIIVYAYFLQPAFFPNQISVSETLPEKFWDLLKIGLGGFVIGRSGEKIASSVSDSLLTRRERRNK